MGAFVENIGLRVLSGLDWCSPIIRPARGAVGFFD